MISYSKISALLLLGILCLVGFSFTRSISYSQIGDVTVKITDDKFICDKIECPTNTERCIVSKEKDPQDTTVLLRSNICYSPTNEELKKTVTKEKVDANTTIKVLIEANKNGWINTSSSVDSRNFNQAEFEEKMKDFHQNLNNRMNNLHKNLGQMQNRLAHMFDS